MSSWPRLEYELWKESYATLHRITQIIGKVRMSLSPWVNHSWSTTLYVTSRGLTTSAVPFDEKILTIDLDLIDHMVIISCSDGRQAQLVLKEQSIASFYQSFLIKLADFDITPTFDPHPNECSDYIGFAEDHVHHHYNKEHIRTFFDVLVRVHNVMNEFRADFSGKVSPVHFFWGSFDLAVTRFSGRLAPEHPGAAPHISKTVMKEGYSHELSSCGFWPGNDLFPEAAIYSYAYPAPQGFERAKVEPREAYFNQQMGEFMLPYNEIIKSSNPREKILQFLNSTFRAASELAHWDEERYRGSPYLQELQSKYPASLQ